MFKFNVLIDYLTLIESKRIILNLAINEPKIPVCLLQRSPYGADRQALGTSVAAQL